MPEHAVADEDQQVGALERWRQTEPLRLWLYGIAVPLLAALVGYGLLADAHSVLWLAVLQAVLLGAGTEGARQFVVSPATAVRAVQSAVRNAWDDVDEDPELEYEVARDVLIRYRIPR